MGPGPWPSNAVAIPVDSAIFVLVAFGGVLAGATVWEIFWVNVAFKMVVTLNLDPLDLLRAADAVAGGGRGRTPERRRRAAPTEPGTTIGWWGRRNPPFHSDRREEA